MRLISEYTASRKFRASRDRAYRNNRMFRLSERPEGLEGSASSDAMGPRRPSLQQLVTSSGTPTHAPEMLGMQAPSGIFLSAAVACPRPLAFPARSAHRPAPTADLVDRWARVRVDSPDTNRAPRALSTHKPAAISKPAQRACSLSCGEVPKAEVGTRRRARSVALVRTWHVGPP